MSSNQRKRTIYFFLAIPVVFLFLGNLSDRYLWGDEAETAMLAKNITRYGVPKVYDGKNTVTLYGIGGGFQRCRDLDVVSLAG